MFISDFERRCLKLSSKYENMSFISNVHHFEFRVCTYMVTIGRSWFASYHWVQNCVYNPKKIVESLTLAYIFRSISDFPKALKIELHVLCNQTRDVVISTSRKPDTQNFFILPIPISLNKSQNGVDNFEKELTHRDAESPSSAQGCYSHKLHVVFIIEGSNQKIRDVDIHYQNSPIIVIAKMDLSDVVTDNLEDLVEVSYPHIYVQASNDSYFKSYGSYLLENTAKDVKDSDTHHNAIIALCIIWLLHLIWDYSYAFYKQYANRGR